MALLTVEATTAEELDVAFASAASQHADAIIDLGDPLTFFQAPRIIALAAKYHLPASTCRKIRRGRRFGRSRLTAICSAVQPPMSIKSSKAPSLPPAVERPTKYE